MTTSRLAILLAIVLAGMSAIFLLPKAPKQQPVGVNLALPDFVGAWIGKDEEVTEQEHQVLGHDTEFARKIYTGPHREQLIVTIVLSGQDMNTSIHRAERCLRAQGWNILDSRIAPIALDKPAGAKLPAMRLRNSHPARNKEALDYYWFVGSTDLTASHVQRSLIDWRDRILKGYNQRWAYVSIIAVLPDNTNPQIEKLVDGSVEDFVRQLVPHIHRDSLKYGT